MLDHFEGDGEVEGTRCEREACGGSLHEARVRERLMRPRVGHSVGRNVETYNLASLVRQLSRAVSGPAANIEHVLIGGERRRESVARNVFSPEVVADAFRDDTLAGELNHRAATPAPSFEFTSTLQ